MIEYLRQLIQDQQWQTALSYAEQLASKANLTPHDLAVLYFAILRSRGAMGDYAGAIVAGELAIKFASEVEDWDSYGSACNDLGVAHFMLKQYDKSIHYFGEYIGFVARYEQALKFHTLVWYNLSCAYRAAGNGSGAIYALTKALEQARSTGDAEWASGLTLALADARLKAGEVDQVPRLLAQSGHYLRCLSDNRDRFLYLTTYRTEFALRTARLRRARMLAVKGLTLSEGQPRHRFGFHMLLSKIELAANANSNALDHALSARAYASICQRPDLEAQASELVETFSDKPHN